MARPGERFTAFAPVGLSLLAVALLSGAVVRLLSVAFAPVRLSLLAIAVSASCS